MLSVAFLAQSIVLASQTIAQCDAGPVSAEDIALAKQIASQVLPSARSLADAELVMAKRTRSCEEPVTHYDVRVSWHFSTEWNGDVRSTPKVKCSSNLGVADVAKAVSWQCTFHEHFLLTFPGIDEPVSLGPYVTPDDARRTLTHLVHFIGPDASGREFTGEHFRRIERVSGSGPRSPFVVWLRTPCDTRMSLRLPRGKELPASWEGIDKKVDATGNCSP